MNPAFVVGIDLGTTNTVVAAANVDGGPVSDVALPQTTAPHEVAVRPQLPSALYRAALSECAPSAAALPWDATPLRADFVGAYGKLQGDKAPGRVVLSAKSWLSVAGVDRRAAILPWAAASDVDKMSPVEMSSRILSHVRHAWDHAHPDAPLVAQDVVITIPASFDEVARELTVEAAEQAGLAHVRLLEEPQAALYALLARHSHSLAQLLAHVRAILVIDIGGGTTDLSLVTVTQSGAGPPTLTRVAVGEHLMLGGDNMDITLARAVEQHVAGAVGALDAAAWAALVHSARHAKETLLSFDGPQQVGVSVLSRGKKLVANSTTHQVSKQDVEQMLLDGFFPRVSSTLAPSKRNTALSELGLPYAHDPAITKHLAAFLRRHAGSAAAAGARIHHGIAVPDAVVFNGGVLMAPRVQERLLEVISSWCPEPVALLGGDDARADNTNHAFNHAVARGAAFSGLVRRGFGLRIGGGSARAYFVGLGESKAATAPARAVCVVPRGFAEGERARLDRTFRLLLDRPVGFALYASTSSGAGVGDVVDVSDDFDVLPPLSTVLNSEPDVPVNVESFLSEVGTLELSLHMAPAALRSFKLAFSTRTQASVDSASTAPGELPKVGGAALPKNIEEGRDLLLTFFGNKAKDVDKAKVKDLRRDLEKLFGPREAWSIATNRELSGVLLAGHKNRRRSLDHERAFFLHLGFVLRPGVGAHFDDWRIEQLWSLFADGVQHTGEKPTWASWFVLWRRVCGGLDATKQAQVYAYLKPWLLLQGTGEKGSGPTPHGQDEMVRLACALERIAVADKVELGAFVQKKLGRGGITSFWPLGRLGARLPLFGSAHTVVPPDVVAAWVERTLAADLKTSDGAAYALVQMCRLVGDRTLDVDDTLRERVATHLQHAQVPAAWVRMVREKIDRNADDQAQAFGEALPPGLHLA